LGFTKAIVEIANAERPDLKGEMELLVDSGASYSIIRSDFLGKLQIRALEEREFTLANGQKISRKLGGVQIRIGARVGYSSIIFGEPRDQQVLGVTALEELGLELDPVTKQLRPAELFLLSFY
jgi:clan AA aspartic protease